MDAKILLVELMSMQEIEVNMITDASSIKKASNEATSIWKPLVIHYEEKPIRGVTRSERCNTPNSLKDILKRDEVRRCKGKALEMTCEDDLNDLSTVFTEKTTLAEKETDHEVVSKEEACFVEYFKHSPVGHDISVNALSEIVKNITSTNCISFTNEEILPEDTGHIYEVSIVPRPSTMVVRAFDVVYWDNLGFIQQGSPVFNAPKAETMMKSDFQMHKRLGKDNQRDLEVISLPKANKKFRGTRVEDDIDDVDFKVPICNLEQNIEEDEYDISHELLRLIEQEEKKTMPYQATLKVINLGTPEEVKEDMSGLDTEIVTHRLPLKLELATYPNWVANIVPVPKKNGKVRMYVDYRDLNRASPKDRFPLPHIDMLVDNTARLKNAGATYPRAMVTLFHDLIHKEIEVYVDGFIVSHEGIKMDPNKIKAIVDLRLPKTEKEIIKGSVIADCLAKLPIEDYEPMKFDFPYEDIMVIVNTSPDTWTMMFDGAINEVGHGV
ncbi:uncharacterized protein E5676_scaffold259G00210 [Cucumis melo var. makuwa]|uniref:Uncharacterized protein n=1 Tax=Cucumis melo var. makuwa TaxID=1194695 RepID=A0A5D3CXC1_CUCMM|nr:uncharacterized protein E6C27_scaffold538G001050 [Cucumis melo var. makuwa]TYK15096.1 uncharacterized protein E5676_scaffold259G00210 [Cucumis melo var. makuwa]